AKLQTLARPDESPQPCELTRRSVLRLSGLTGTGVLAPGLLAACWGSTTPSYEATIADARIAVRQALVDTETPSISVALIDRERVIWAEAFGVIDKETKAAPTPDTLFCIGSCSKMLAAIASMILVERGKLDLDAPLVRYLSNFRMASPEYTQVTVRMLLNHSSGFPGADYRGIFRSGPFSGYAEQVMNALSTARLKHVPGEMSVYCNDGFTMLEPLIKAISGKSYAQFVTDEILAPLGMKRSTYSLQAFAAGSYASAYDGTTKLPQEYTLAYASGGLYTTPTEMARIARMFLNGGQFDGVHILQAATLKEMARNQTLTQALQPITTSDGYGLGWDGVRQGGLAAVGVTAWHKNGGTSVYGSNFVVAPDEGLALMITGSSTAYNHGALAERILLQALAERGRIAAVPTPLPAIALPEAVPSAAQLAAIEGIYAHYLGTIRIQVAADRTLSISSTKQGAWAAPTTGWKLRSDGTFSTDAAPNMSYQSASAMGESYLAGRTATGRGHYLVQFLSAQKLAPKPPLSSVWLARLQQTWLAVSEPADSFMWLFGFGPTLTLAAAPDSPGYLLVSAEVIEEQSQITDASVSDSATRMCLRIPGNNSRDLNALIVEPRAGEEWMHLGSSVFRPAQSVPLLAVGATNIAVGSEGFADWRALRAGAAALPIALSGATAWRLYDADFQCLGSGAASASATLPAGTGLAYLMLYGAANTSITVRLG
ncbi:MAG: serine hydrolase domain-containing protein, partial [Rhodoferax sp.]